MSDATPTFAIVGAVNHGKSSVVSTLAENDQVRISAMPGETVECQRFALRDSSFFTIRRVFKTRVEALAAARSGGPGARAAGGLSRVHRTASRAAGFRGGVPAFPADRRRRGHRLRGRWLGAAAGNPRGRNGNPAAHRRSRASPSSTAPAPTIMCRTGSGGSGCTSMRCANSTRTTPRSPTGSSCSKRSRASSKAGSRSSCARWRSFARSGSGGWANARRSSSGCWSMRSRISEVAAADPESQARRAALGEELQQRFRKAVSAREARAQQEIIRLFGHNRVKAEARGRSAFRHGLFSDETWRAFGLDERQLVAAGADRRRGGRGGREFRLGTVGHPSAARTAAGVGAARRADRVSSSANSGPS